MPYDLPNTVYLSNLAYPQNIAANTDFDYIDTLNYTGVIGAIFSVGAPSNLAASPKLNFVMQDSAAGTTFADVAGANVNVTNTNSVTQLAIDTRTVNRYLRVRANIAGGNSPGWPASIVAYATPKYNPNSSA